MKIPNQITERTIVVAAAIFIALAYGATDYYEQRAEEQENKVSFTIYEVEE
jgi:hypothetical protein